MVSNVLPHDATFEHLQGTLAKRVEYLRRVVANLETQGAHKQDITVRIGIAGKGLAPHYKFEAAVPYVVVRADGVETDSRVIQRCIHRL